MARSFNGTSDKITFGGSLITATPPYTIAAWANPSSTAGIQNVLACGGTGYAVQLRRDGTAWNLYQHNSGGSDVVASYPGGVVASEWSFVGGDWDGGDIHLWIAGVLRATTVCTSIMASHVGTANSWGNDQADGGAQFWNGLLAEGAIWNAVLTASEWAALAAGVSPFRVRPQSLIHYLPMFGLASPEPDLSGNANNGTLTGTTPANHPPVTLFTRKARAEVQAAGGGTAYTLSATPGVFGLTGNAATLSVGRKLNAAPGALSLTGAPATLSVGRKLSASAGAFALSGANATLSVGRKLSASPATFALSGSAASLTVNRVLNADPATFTLSGAPAAFRAPKKLSASPGVFTLGGQAAALKVGRVLNAGAGSFSLSGANASLKVSRTLIAAPDRFSLVGFAATFVVSSHTQLGGLTFLAKDPGRHFTVRDPGRHFRSKDPGRHFTGEGP